MTASERGLEPWNQPVTRAELHVHLRGVRDDADGHRSMAANELRTVRSMAGIALTVALIALALALLALCGVDTVWDELHPSPAPAEGEALP